MGSVATSLSKQQRRSLKTFGSHLELGNKYYKKLSEEKGRKGGCERVVENVGYMKESSRYVALSLVNSVPMADVLQNFIGLTSQFFCLIETVNLLRVGLE